MPPRRSGTRAIRSWMPPDVAPDGPGERELVRHMLSRLQEPQPDPAIAALGAIDGPHIRGDAAFFHHGQAGLHFGLLCDATGHGLLAGISTIPVADVFRGAVSRDVPLEIVYREINHKLLRLLPVGRFVCLLLLRLNTRLGTLSVLNAGLPPALLSGAGDWRTFPSIALPVGIQEGAEALLQDIPEVLVSPGDRLLACTDGVFEGLGEATVTAHFRDTLSLPLPDQQEALQGAFSGGSGEDDRTWLLLQVPKPPPPPESGAAKPADPQGAFQVGLELRMILRPGICLPGSFLPALSALLEAQGLDDLTIQSLSMLLSEAVSNAVDHGILGLDSRIKDTGGFEAYDAARRSALSRHPEGHLVLTLALLHAAAGQPPCRIQVHLEDSGPGFDWRHAGPSAPTCPHGRGMAILRALAPDLSYGEHGNSLAFSLPLPT